MPAVNHLRRLRGTLAGGPGKLAGAVQANNPHRRLDAQPGNHGCELPIRQPRNRHVAVQVDSQGAILVAEPPSPLVDPDDLRRGNGG